MESRTGLVVTPSSERSASIMSVIIDDSPFYAEPYFGGFFFPEDEDCFDSLESELDSLFAGEGVNYSITTL